MNNGTTIDEVPAYVSYRTHLNAIAALREDGIPSRLDTSVRMMGRMSGGTRGQLIRAWRFLGLINDDDRPQPILERLVDAEGEEKQQVLRQILQNSYPFLLGDKAHPFDLASATDRELYERFSQLTPASGETIRKCMSFFLHAAVDAGINVSKHISMTRSSSEQNRSGRGRSTNGKKRQSLANSDNGQLSPPPVSPKSPDRLENLSRRPNLKEMLVAKLPEFNPEWNDEVQAKWFEAFNRMWDSLENKEELEE